MKFTVYRLGVSPGEAEEGQDHDEWFTSLEAAAKKRRQYVEQAEEAEDYQPDFEIEKITTIDVPPKALFMAMLSRIGWVAARETVVPEWDVREKRRAERAEEEEPSGGFVQPAISVEEWERRR